MPRERRVIGGEDLARHLLVLVVEAGLVEAEAPGQASEHLGRRQTLPRRRHRRLVPRDVEVPVGDLEIGVLELGGGGEDQVRVLDGVRAEVLRDHREEVGSLQALPDLRLVRHAGQRIARVDEERLDGRVLRLEEALAEPRHAERARDGGPQVVAIQGRPVHAEEPAGVVAGAAAGMAPVPRDPGDAGDGPDRHPPAPVPLEPHGQPDPRGAGVREPPPELHDGLDRKAGDARDALRRILEDALAERVPAERVARDEVPVLRALGQHDVQEAQRQRGIRARDRRQVGVRDPGGPGPDGVDHDEVGARLAGHRDAAPEMVVAGQRVAAPQDDELREAQRLGIHPHAVVAQRVAGPVPAGDRADRHQVPRGSEDVPQPAPCGIHALEEAHAAGADVGPDRLGAEFPDDGLEPPGDLVERVVPGDALELAPALRTDPPHRIEETLGRLGIGDVVVELRAQDAARERVLGIALEPHRAPVLHGHDPAARVRAVHRARSENPRFSAHGHAPCVRSVAHAHWAATSMASPPGHAPRRATAIQLPGR